MAVPKKRMSKSKKNIRKNIWKNKAKKSAAKALSIAKYVLYCISKKATKTSASMDSTIRIEDPKNSGFSTEKS